jgi:hypothetical protein
MKTKDITKATEPGNHYDSVAIFKLEQPYYMDGIELVRLMTPAEKPTLQHGWNHHNKNKPSYISVVEVEPIDANGNKRQYGDHDFICVGFRDKISGMDGTVLTKTVHVSRIACQMNDAESIVTVYNDIVERRAQADERERKIANARARQKQQNIIASTQVVAAIRERFNASVIQVCSSNDYSKITIDVNILKQLVDEAEAARKLNVVA